MKNFKMKSSVLVGSLFLLTGIISKAQEINFSLGTQFHFSTFDIEGALSDTDIEPGAGLELGIQFKLSEHWSLNSGVGYAFHQARNSSNLLKGSQTTVDSEGEDFTFNYQISGYSETQKFNNVSIPLNVQYEGSGVTRLYVKAGASYNLLSNARQESRASSLTTSGYFPRFNGTLTAPAFAGFGTYNDIQFSEQDFELSNSVNATFEIGIKQLLAHNSAMYFGAFLDYGLNDVVDSPVIDGTLSFNPTSPTDFVSNGSFNASNGNSRQVEEAKLIFGGIKIRYQFGTKAPSSKQ
ncbi:hypothetical protein BST86_07840 [Nonlabens agnitus]|uniref:Outer membrane protein beta-barrel domain-containing protein n=2 Tax=Nonlabens agnitus TaxID=870484 RepID=A0A2S9WUK3_9FLAO|nr:hypothetical protein BST86_07840 [Nonlabens agnitus]